MTTADALVVLLLLFGALVAAIAVEGALRVLRRHTTTRETR